jgi:hypothetical protein
MLSGEHRGERAMNAGVGLMIGVMIGLFTGHLVICMSLGLLFGALADSVKQANKPPGA